MGIGLKYIKLPENVEYIGNKCFSGSSLEEITLPASLIRVEKNIFEDCEKLRIVWLEDGCMVDVSSYVNDSVMVLPAKYRMVGKRPLLSLWKLKDVTIPDGVQEIGERWFKNSEIESIVIPVSTVAIGKEAFRNC